MRLASAFPITAALAVGAVAGALASALLHPRCASDDAPSAAPVAPEIDLRARLDALTRADRELRERLALLELRPAPAERVPAAGFASKEELAALRAELRELRATLEAHPDPEPVAFREEVADALGAIRKREAVEAVRSRQEKRAARLEDDLSKLAQRLGLTPYQVGGMRAALLAQYEREEEVRRLWEEDAPDEVLAEAKREAGELFRSELELVLGPEQLQTFWTDVLGRGKK